MKAVALSCTKALLLKQGARLFEPCYDAGFDFLLLQPDSTTARVLVLSLPLQGKPIVSLYSRRSHGEPHTRPFDLLYIVDTNTLTFWKIPHSDVPDKPTLYLSARYDVYKLAFLECPWGFRQADSDSISLNEIAQQIERDRELLGELTTQIDDDTDIERLLQ